MSATPVEVEVEVEVSSGGGTGTKVAAWLFDKFVGGAFTKAGGVAMSYALALIGIKEESTEVVERLDRIQQGIDEILREVRALKVQIEALAKQLQLSTMEIIAAIGESAINDSRSAIDTHFGTALALLEGQADPLNITSLGEGVRYRLARKDVDTKTFARNVLGTWDIQRHVVKIAQIAASSTTFVTRPLLKGWTDYLIEKNRGHAGSNALTMYLTLEGFFQQLLEIQFKGIALVAMAKCYDKSEADARVITEAFLADIAPHIELEANLFAQCANEIVLAVFTDDAPTKWLYSPGGTQAAPAVTTILRRANLLRAVVRGAIGKGPKTISGIYGAMLGRNFERENEMARIFAPTGFAASSGDAIGPLETAPGFAPIEWEGQSNNTHGILRPKAKSGFQAVHYQWPFTGTLPEAGKPIDPSFDGGLTPRWYDLETFEPAATGGEGKVLVADFSTMRVFRGVIFSEPYVADVAMIPRPSETGCFNVNDNRFGVRTNEVYGIHLMRADETFNRLLAKGTLDVQMRYHDSQGGGVGYELTFPLFRYSGPGATLELKFNAKMVLELVSGVKPTNKDGYSTMRMCPRAVLSLRHIRPQGSPEDIQILRTNDEPHWGKASPTRTTEDRIVKFDAQLTNAEGTEDYYSLVLAFEVINGLDQRKTDPGELAHGRITYDLSGFQIMWK